MLDILTLGAARKYTDTVGQRIIEQIEEEPIFRFKGVKDLISELPSTGNTVGDIWHVNEDGNEYVWIESGNVGSWEEFGGTFQPQSELQKFVTTLPNSNIDENALYYIKYNKIFPDTTSYIGAEIEYAGGTKTTPYVAVTYNSSNNVWRMARFDVNEFWYIGEQRGRSRVYQAYEVSADGLSWEPLYDIGQNSDQWINDLYIVQKKYAEDLVIFTNASRLTNPANNEADQYGVPTNPTDTDTYLTYHYNGTSWDMLGLSSYDTLLANTKSRITALETDKLDIDQGSTNAGKFMKVDNDGNLVPDTVPTTTLQSTIGQSTTDGMTQKAITDALSGKLDAPLIFTNLAIAAADWTDNATTPDEGFESYAYKATITGLTGVTADMLGTVIYTPTQIESGNYAEDCVTGAASITIYSKSDAATTIPTVIVGTPITVVSVNSGTQLHNYSTSEQVVGSWIDGRPIYETTINRNIDYRVNGDWVNSGIIIQNIDDIISFNAAGYDRDSNEKGIVYPIFTKITSNGILVYFTTGWKFTGTNTTIQYTKTTDIANN